MAVNSGDFVQAAGLLNNLVEQANGDLEHLDMSLYISVGKNYDGESGGGAVTLQSKSITKTPTRQQQQQTVYPDPGFDGLSSVGVTVEAIPSEYVIPSGSVTITQNGTVDVSGKAQAIVNVPTGVGHSVLTGAKMGTGRSFSVECPFEPSCVIIDAPTFGEYLGTKAVVLDNNTGFSCTRYATSAGGTIQNVFKSGITNFNQGTSQSYAHYAVYSDGVLTITATSSAGRVAFNSNIEYKYTIF